MVYRSIETSLWSDPRIRGLKFQGRYLFLYLITNTHTHVGGIYYLPRMAIALETGLSDKVSQTALDTLSGANLAHYDDDHQVVWVVNMFRYQGRGEKNAIAVANHLRTLHASPLIDDFLDRYPHVQRFIKRTPVKKRGGLPTTLRYRVLERDEFTCQYCGEGAPDVVLEVDHIVPTSRGGRDEIENLKTSCARCNNGKRDRVSGVGPQEQEQEQEKEIKTSSRSATPSRDNGSEIGLVWNHFADRHPKAVLDEKRRKIIGARLKAGYTVEQLTTAIDGLHLSRWHVEKGNLTIEYGLRNAQQIEKLIDIAETPGHAERVRGKKAGRTCGCGRALGPQDHGECWKCREGR